MNNKIDIAVFKWMQAHHNEWATYFFRDITSFGGVTGSVSVLLFSLGVLFLLGSFKVMAIIGGIFLASSLLTTIIKQVVHRPRPLPYDPDTHIWESAGVDHFISVPHFCSFPSGHTVSSVVLYSMLALHIGHSFPVLAHYLLGCALGLAALVGLSRTYLCAHWASDVLAGYIFGLGFVYLSHWFL